ncbi:unnamed protein product [marine sediment metagenome]|uniref:Uncharacterized protein n=1 Tax=marine sediment metagenome TaxID=412755 RepID=X1M885_9ZZZZ
MELAKPKIIKAVMKEFIARGLDKVYAKEIKEWKKYKKGKKYTKKLNKKMKDEIEKFEKNIKEWTPKELEEIVWDISK